MNVGEISSKVMHQGQQLFLRSKLKDFKCSLYGGDPGSLWTTVSN